MTHGLQFLASYTWAHTLDVTTDSNGGGTPMNPYNWKPDYGNSNWDIRHRFVASFVYDIPFFQTSNGLLKCAFGNWQSERHHHAADWFSVQRLHRNRPANTATSGTQRPDLVGTPSPTAATAIW